MQRRGGGSSTLSLLRSKTLLVGSVSGLKRLPAPPASISASRRADATEKWSFQETDQD
jgi:hypothetical protein